MEKRYGLPTAIAMVIGTVIGSGVFIKGGKLLNMTGGALGQAVLVVGIVGVICIICSLVFAELGSKYEKVNGVVDYAEVALGPKYAYYVGWFMSTIYTPCLSAILAFFAAVFFCALCGIPALDFTNGTVSAAAVGLGGGFLMIGYCINAISPKLAGKLQVSMTVIKLIPLILMGVVGTIVGLVNGSTMEVINYVHTDAFTPATGGIFGGVVAFAFSYEGWILATSINSELKNAKRNLPLALIIGAVFCTVIYCLYIFSLSSVGDVGTIIGTWPLGETLPKIAFSGVFGNVVGTIVYVFVTISCLGTMNGLIMGSSRGLYAVSCRGMGPKPEFFGDVDKQNNFAIKSAIFGMLCGGFWYGWTAILWMHGPDFMGGIHNFIWIGWEPDEISIVNLYAMYIPMFVALMVKSKEFGPVKRFVLPILGIICCVFMVYSCCVGKGYKQVIGYIIFFVIVMFIGWLINKISSKKRERLPDNN
ncbi:MAG: APC family permease [Oscillospiraceae bacterium]|nr:APC family permease [Oscillospiraceae bacterium]